MAMDDYDDFCFLRDTPPPSRPVKKKRVDPRWEHPPPSVVRFTLDIYSEDSTLFGFPGAKDKVASMRMTHETFPSVFFKFKEAFDDWAEAYSRSTRLWPWPPLFPPTLALFEKVFPCRFVISGGSPAPQRQVPWARGVYFKLSQKEELIDWMYIFF